MVDLLCADDTDAMSDCDTRSIWKHSSLSLIVVSTDRRYSSMRNKLAKR